MEYPYRNKEISWLAFNARVLQEASDRSVPLIERIRYLGIFSSNQDEFFRVRVATLHRLARLGKKGSRLLGHAPLDVIARIREIILHQQEIFQGVYRQLFNELSNEGIHLVDETRLTAEQGDFVRAYFRDKVRPMLTPLMLTEKHKFPDLEDRMIYLATRLCTSRAKDDRFSLIEVPTDVLPRFLILPDASGEQFVILLENVIRYNLTEIFSLFKFDRIESHIVKLTRDAELELDDDVTESYIRKVVKGLKNREEGNPVRLVYDREISERFLNKIFRGLGLSKEDSLVPGGRTHNHKDFIDFPRIGPPSLLYPKLEPAPVPELSPERSMLSALKKREVLLHFPYQSFEYVIDLLREAAIDPKVSAIKVTLYRVARYSGVANALINAARNGKSVTAIIELQARFDERANVALANQLQEEGAQVIFGVPGLKVHAKIGIIHRKEKGRTARCAFLGTGNFNEDTARLYTDHCLFTTDPKLTREVDAVFDFLENNYRVSSFRHLLVAPFNFRKGLAKLVRTEMRNARKGKRAHILLKLNNLTDPELIGLLHQAVEAGVRVALNVRGMFSLLPDAVPIEVRDRLESIAIIDRFLEHTRIFMFANGGNEKFYLSSGDWMTRNLDRRVEVMFPVNDPALQQQLREYWNIQWADNVKARVLDGELTNRYRPRRGKAVRSQVALQEWLRSRSHGKTRSVQGRKPSASVSASASAFTSEKS
jgi:polyphosphate kinase